MSVRMSSQLSTHLFRVRWGSWATDGTISEAPLQEIWVRVVWERQAAKG